MHDLSFLNELGVSTEIISHYQILCLPEGVENKLRHDPLVDTDDSITLSKILKETGLECANSYDLGLATQVYERRNVDFWFGSIWVLKHAAVPILSGIISRLVVAKIQRKINEHGSDKPIIHADLKLKDGQVNGEIKFDGDADLFLKVLNSIGDGKSSGSE